MMPKDYPFPGCKNYPFPESPFFVAWKTQLRKASFTVKDIKKIMLTYDRALLVINPIIMVDIHGKPIEKKCRLNGDVFNTVKREK